MRSPVRIRVAAPDNPEEKSSGLWLFIGSCRTSVGVFCYMGLPGAGITIWIRLCANGADSVRIPHSEIGKLVCQAKSVGIFAFSEYPGSSSRLLAAARSPSRKNSYQLFFYTLRPLRYSLRLGHTRGKTTLSCFLTPSCRFATERNLRGFGFL